MHHETPWLNHWPQGVPESLDYPDIPLYGFLTRAAEQWPEKVAFSLDDRTLTYRELESLSDNMAAGLAGLGVKPGDKVLLFLPNSLEFVISYYGVLKAGATVTTVNPLSRFAELTHQLADTRAAVLVTGRDYVSLAKEVRPGTTLETIVVVDSDEEDNTLPLEKLLVPSGSIPRPRIVPAEDAAAIVYTGGTTGLSKGVLLTHRNLVANAMQNNAWFSWTSDDVVVGLLPFYHAWGGCTGINAPVDCGARVVIVSRFDPESFLSLIERERVTVVYGASSMFTTLINHPALGSHDISSLRYVKSGAMPIPPEIRARWEELTGVKMVLGYGLSEASPETHNSPLERVKAGTIGIPCIDTEARIVDEETGTIDMAPGQPGEIILRGPQVMKGYLNRPEDTAEALREGWLYTGDLGIMDEEGYFYALDRKKETIKYKGYTIAPAEVEAVLYEHPSVRECAVVGKPDDMAGEIPKAFVVLKDDCKAGHDELISFCAEKIAPYKRIREVEFIDEIPKTGVGKMLRRILRDRERDAQDLT